MNPRDIDAFYDAIKAYGLVRAGTTSRESTEELNRDFARAILGRWKLDRDDDVRYADERAWVKDIFKAETTCWTEERDRYPGFAPRRSKPVRNEELQAGDTTELDGFLASFNK